tara:strand:- start:4 stop:813 length:810 start_codon:yes stop_codon:yes gene_type:complete
MVLNYKSPAKVNLFLKILDKRSDGYHNIQSIFQLIDLYDEISLKERKDSLIKFRCTNKKIEKNNIIKKSIDSFLKYTKVRKKGIDIFLKKNIPIGSGLGGGSSNAATCLLALNDLYNTRLTLTKLASIGKKIGSDVPFFIYNKNAWVEGMGDIVTPIYVKPAWFILIFGEHSISTSEIYSSFKKKSYSNSYSYDNYLFDDMGNDFENVVFKKYPKIHKSHKCLSKYGKARMTGTGGTIFLRQSSFEDAKKVISLLPKNENAIVIKSLDI